jgi:uncharacterized membrane protein
MSSSRLEAFSDGVIAIIITIMVLELRAPQDFGWAALWTLWPVFLSYLLSFIIAAIYWINHHHLLHLASKVDTRLLWANTNLLFWMSLMPFTTAWLGRSAAAPVPTACYAGVAAMNALSFYILRAAVTRQHVGNKEIEEFDRRLARKKLLALAIYLTAIPVAFLMPALSLALCALPACMYFLPTRHPVVVPGPRR